jgi:hypothetical protein
MEFLITFFFFRLLPLLLLLLLLLDFGRDCGKQVYLGERSGSSSSSSFY